MTDPTAPPCSSDYDAATTEIRANLSAGPAAMSSATQSHILVVDDDPAMRKLIGDYLAENSLRVTPADTGAAMQQALAQHTIDLVVLDLRLAAEDGMQLARDLR